MVVNFRTHEINRDTHKLARTPILIKKNYKHVEKMYIIVNKIQVTRKIFKDPGRKK